MLVMEEGRKSHSKLTCKFTELLKVGCNIVTFTKSNMGGSVVLTWLAVQKPFTIRYCSIAIGQCLLQGHSDMQTAGVRCHLPAEQSVRVIFLTA